MYTSGLMKTLKGYTALIETMIIRPFYKESILEKTYSHKNLLLYFVISTRTERLHHIATLHRCKISTFFLNCAWSLIINNVHFYGNFTV